MINKIVFDTNKSSVTGFVSWDRLKKMVEATGNNEEITHFEITEQGINFGVKLVPEVSV